MSLRIPYHPPSNELTILFHGLPCADDTYISVFCLDMSTPIEFSFSDKQNWLYRHSFEDDDNVDKPYTIIEEDTRKKEDDNRPIEVGGRRVRLIIQRGDNNPVRLPPGRKRIVIHISRETLILAFFSFYLLYYTDVLTSFIKKINSFLPFRIPVFVYWLVINILQIILPTILDLIAESKAKKKDIVDYMPQNILGDVFLCIYYFFASVLSWNWGPRVFRD